MHHAIANDARHRDADLMRGQQLKQWRGGHFAAGVQIDCNAPRARFTKEAQSAARCLVCCDAALARRKTKAPRAKFATQRLFDEVGVSRVCRHRFSRSEEHTSELQS